MSNSDRTIRQRLLDRAVLRILLPILIIAFGFPLVNNMLITPYVADTAPLLPNTPRCTSLPSPLGGNQRSLLAYRLNRNDGLDIELILDNRYAPQTDVDITVIVRNVNRGPIVLLWPDQQPIITPSATEAGLTLQIQRLSDNFVFTQGGSYQPTGTLPQEDLHVLGSGARCRQSYTIPATTLNGLGIGLGNYDITATYRNLEDGGPETFFELDGWREWMTPIPEYANNQGVWTTSPAGITSNRATLRIANASPPQPAQ